jgi:single-strand DNA-binding protein
MNSYSTTGLVATSPRHLITQEGLPITSFRLACTDSYFDEDKNQWVNNETNWFTVTAFRTLGINVAQSVSKGHRITVSGAIKVRDWDNGERSGTSVEIIADSIGHDLNFGTSEFTRAQATPPTTTTEKPQHNCSCDKCDRSNK